MSFSIRWVLRSLGVGAILITGISCDSATGPDQPVMPVVTSIRVELAEQTLVEGQSSQATAVVLDQNGTTMSGVEVGWSSTAPQVASISSGGVLAALSPGVASIRASSNGVVGQATVTVTVDGWTSLAAGRDHTCGLRIDGRLFCWGNNDSGQLGDGTSTASSTPTLVAFPSGLDVVAVDAAGNQSCALTRNGALYCWGANLHGELGNGTTNDSAVPTPVVTSATFTAFSMGPLHVCALDSSGLAYCWGGGIANPGANLALGFDPPDVCVQTSTYFSQQCSTIPRALPTPLRFNSISAGLFLTCATRTNGEGYCWGWNRYAQLGDGPNSAVTPGTSIPQVLSGALVFKSVDAGGLHGCGLATSGAAHCWGARLGASPNQFNLGQLGGGGLPNADGSEVPQPVVGGHSFTSLVTGAENNVRALYTCGITTTQDVLCWGANGQSQLGGTTPETCAAISNMTISCTASPQPVSGGLRASKVRLGLFHTCALALDGEIYCWGQNDDGQLGNDSVVSSALPVLVQRQ